MRKVVVAVVLLFAVGNVDAQVRPGTYLTAEEAALTYVPLTAEKGSAALSQYDPGCSSTISVPSGGIGSWTTAEVATQPQIIEINVLDPSGDYIAISDASLFLNNRIRVTVSAEITANVNADVEMYVTVNNSTSLPGFQLPVVVGFTTQPGFKTRSVILDAIRTVPLAAQLRVSFSSRDAPLTLSVCQMVMNVTVLGAA